MASRDPRGANLPPVGYLAPGWERVPGQHTVRRIGSGDSMIGRPVSRFPLDGDGGGRATRPTFGGGMFGGIGRRRPRFPTEPEPIIEPPNPTEGIPGEEGSGNGNGGETDPFNRLADAFLAAMMGGGRSTPRDDTPYVVVDPNYSEGNGMNWKTIAVVALVGVGIWFAWKKWGKKATAAASE